MVGMGTLITWSPRSLQAHWSPRLARLGPEAPGDSLGDGTLPIRSVQGGQRPPPSPTMSA